MDPICDFIEDSVFESELETIQGLDAAMESVNSDATAIYREHSKKMKALKKEFKQLSKEKNYSEAAKKAEELRDMCRESKKLIDKLPDSVSAALLALIGRMLIFAGTAVIAWGTYGVCTKMIHSAIGIFVKGAPIYAIGAAYEQYLFAVFAMFDGLDAKGNLHLKVNDVNIHIAKIKAVLDQQAQHWNDAAITCRRYAKYGNPKDKK